MIKDNNYTGYACYSRVSGNLEAVSSYNAVGMYTPCVWVENDIAKRLLIGGFSNDNGIPINKKVEVFVQEVSVED